MHSSVTNVEFEAALSNSLQHFLHISSLKREQKLCLETVAQRRDLYFLNSTYWFWEESYFSIAAASTEQTERVVKTRTCLCLS